MTAEIVVMNCEAVALAADSAATIGDKIYQTANKLFTLSKKFPVGIMISNNADFMGVPWETLVKTYREKNLEEPELDLLEEYCESFLASLGDPKIGTAEQQKQKVSQIVSDHLRHVKNHAQPQWMKRLLKDGKCSRRDKTQIFEKALEEYRDHLATFPDHKFHSITEPKLLRRYRKEISDAIQSTLRAFNLPRKTLGIAHECAKLGLLKEIASDGNSTVAFAGFGREQFFPALEVVQIDGIIGDEIKITSWDSSVMDPSDQLSTVVPLAQKEMVHRFMDGVDDSYQDEIERWFNVFCSKIGLDTAAVAKATELFHDHFEGIRRDKFSAPITRTLVNLPKDEMARMAEALVNLTLIKRRVSEEMETVAGPVDVAVISKGDGFIWIKRKHYFSPELNPHFGDLYLRGR
jgi:hypothetical protein